MSSASLPAQLQSVLSPAGQAAQSVTGMSWILIGGAALIFTGVMALLVWSLRQRAPGQSDQANRVVSKRLWLLGGGVVFPAVVLMTLLIWSTARTPGWLAQPPPGALIAASPRTCGGGKSACATPQQGMRSYLPMSCICPRADQSGSA